MALHHVNQSTAASGDGGPPPTLEFLEKQLADEYTAKQSFETRGMAVITAAATLATLSFGIAKFATPGSAALKGVPAWTLLAAILGFVAAALCGLMANWPSKKYRLLTEAGLDDIVSEERWLLDPDDVRWALAQSLVAMVKGARSANDRKAGWLMAAVVCQVGALVALFATAAQLLSA